MSSQGGPAPRISIIVPLYNREWAIGGCLRSIGLQAGDPAETIVVDDGSTDGSLAAARAAMAEIDGAIEIISQGNAGPGAARNRAAQVAQGDWLVFLDSDDLWFPWTLGAWLHVLEGADAELAFAADHPFSDTAQLAEVTGGAVTSRTFLDFLTAAASGAGLRLGSCNAAIRREAFARVGGFDTHLRAAEDTDLWLRVGGPTLLVTEPPLVALRGGDHGSLTGNLDHLVDGLNWKIARNAEGAYAGAPAARDGFLADSAVYTIAKAYDLGHNARGAALWARHAARLARTGRWRQLWRLPLRPVLRARQARRDRRVAD